MNDAALNGEQANLKSQLRENTKTIVFFLLFVILAGAVFVSSFLLFGGLLFRIVHVLGFLFLGYLQVRLQDGALDFLNEAQRFFHTLFSAIVLLLFLGLAHFFFSTYTLFLVAAAVAAFGLPYTLDQLWHSFRLFSFSSKKTWSYSEDLSLQKSTTFLNSMPVKFKVQLESGGALQDQVAFRAPVRMKLGLIFYHLVKNQETNSGLPISLVNASQQPFKWVFQTSKFGFVQNLDPDLGLIENGIRQNMLVIAKRLDPQ